MAKEAKTNAMRILDGMKLAYSPHTYECGEFIDGTDIAAKLSLPFEKVFKTLVTQGKSEEYYVFVIPVDKELDLKKAAQAAGRKSIDMIPQKTLFPLTGYVHGGCSPVGMKKLFPTFIDETAQLFDVMFVSGGKVGLNLEIAPDRLGSFIQAQYADLTKNQPDK